MADEINVRYTADTKQIEESIGRVQKELLETDAINKKFFSNFGPNSEQAAKSIDKVTQSAAKAKTGFNSLGNSINQISRELPNFAINAQIGFLAISNNLPILSDAISQLRIQNEALIASNQKAIPIWKSLAASIFSVQTLISVGITLLTIYGSKIVSFIGDLIKGKSTLDETKTKIEAINDAFASKEVSKAVSDYLKLQENVKAAKNGLLDKEIVLKQYNDTVGRTVGFAKSFNEAEQLLIANKNAYIKSITERAAANMLLDKSAELMVKKIELENTKLGEQSVFDLRRLQTREKVRQKEIDDIQKEIDIKTKLATQLYQPNVEQVKQSEKKIEDALVSQYKRQKELLEAKGLDTFDISKKILQRELSLLEKGGKEYLDKQNDIYVLIAARDKKLADEREKRREEENKARIAGEQTILEAESKAAANRLDAIRKRYKDDKEAADKAVAEEKQRIKDLADAKIMAEQSVANVIGAVSTFVGQTTTEGKALAIAEATINTYAAATKILSADAGKGGVFAIISAGSAIAFGLIQVAKIIATQVPTPTATAPQVGGSAGRGTGSGAGFATGVVDLAGPGTSTSDSIPARLSRGESVITAKATAAKKDELFALNYSVLNYDKLIQDKYVKPAIEAERRKQESFASNIATAIHLHAAMDGKKIVKAIKDNRPATAKDIRVLAETVTKTSRKSEFVKSHSI